MKKIFAFMVILWATCSISYGQPVCNGVLGEPILNLTFGQGNASQAWYSPLSTYAPGLSTNTIFQTGGSLPAANTSGLVKNASVFGPAPYWLTSADHTGNPYGLFMGINMPDNIGDTVVEYIMTNLCPNTTLQYSIWLVNLMAPTHPLVVSGSSSIQYPNFIMRIVDASNNVLASQATGNVPTDGIWHQYSYLFSNGTNTTVKLQLINNTSGSGSGNDVALDDITIRPCVPDAQLLPDLDTTLCKSASITFTANITAGVYSNPNYQWQYSTNSGLNWNNSGAMAPLNNHTFAFSTSVAPEEYWIRYLVSPQGIAQNNNCHATSDTSIVRIDTINKDFLQIDDTTICAGTSITLNINSSYASSYVWSTGATTSSIVVNSANTYWAEIYSLYGCKASDTATVHEIQSGVISIGPDTMLCEGTGYTFSVTPDISGSYQWNTGQQTPSITVSAAGTYWVSTTINGCKVSDTAVLAYVENPDVNLGPDRIICKDFLTDIIPDFTFPEATYLWNTGATTSNLIQVDTGTYWLTITRPPGCSSTDTIVISEKICGCTILVPNAFSPNGDGINDDFKIMTSEGCMVQKFDLSIYNRYGQRVFNSPDMVNGWNGLYNGGTADLGIYMYYLRITLADSTEDKIYKGDISLIR